MSIVCIDGMDAVGKATQAKILAERLGATLFSFPDYETVTGKVIKAVLTDEISICRECLDEGSDQHFTENKATRALVLQSLMLTNRMERVADLRAAKGHVVLDRWTPSALVYGTLDGLDPTWIESTNAQLLVEPDVYILLDASVDESFRRRPDRRDRYERDRVYLEKVREGYLRLFTRKQEERAKDLAKRGWTAVGDHKIWRVVNAMGAIDQVSASIWDVCLESGVA